MEGEAAPREGCRPAGTRRSCINTVKFEDVLVGEVWVRRPVEHGFSRVESKGREKEVAAADFPKIRLLTVEEDRGQPQDDAAIEWSVCTPETPASSPRWRTSSGANSIRNWAFRSLDQCLVGGTAIEPGRREGFESVPELKVRRKAAKTSGEPACRGPARPGSRGSIDSRDFTHPQELAHPASCTTRWYTARSFGIRGPSGTRARTHVTGDRLYAARMKALIGGWRTTWGQAVPFYYVQLARGSTGRDTPARRSACENLGSAAGKPWHSQYRHGRHDRHRRREDIHHEQAGGWARLALWPSPGLRSEGIVYSGRLQVMSVEDGRIGSASITATGVWLRATASR